jgi:hypothetical protein
MGLNPTILRQAKAFAFLFQPTDPPPRTRRPYRASGLVLTSTPDGYGVVFAQTPRPLGEWVKSTQGDIGAGTATVHCDPNNEHSVRQGELVLTERAFLLRRSPDSRGPI